MPKKHINKKAIVTPEETTSRSVGNHVIGDNAPVHEHGNPGAGEGAIQSYVETDYALTLPDELTDLGYIEIGKKIGHAMEGASWRIGDWANFGKAKLGYKEYDRLAEITGLSEVYVRTCSSIAARVQPTFRTLASMERFRLLLAMPAENVVIPEADRKPTEDGKQASATRAETIAEKVNRYAVWTSGELRAKKRVTAQLENGGTTTDSSKATGTGAQDAAGNVSSPSTGTAEPVSSSAGTPASSGSTEPGKVYTAGKVFALAGELQDACDGLTPERIAMLSTLEKNMPTIAPLAKMLGLLLEQIAAENK